MDVTHIISPTSFGAFLYSSLAQCLFYGCWRFFEFRARGGAPETAAERKRRAWCLSLAVSTLWTFVLAPYFTAAFFWHFAAGHESLLAFCAQDSPLLRGLVIHFFTFLLLDIVFGVTSYAEHLKPDTTWAHHISYMLLLLAILYNGTPVIFLCVSRRRGAPSLCQLGRAFLFSRASSTPPPPRPRPPPRAQHFQQRGVAHVCSRAG
jgi:hypothetical protein